ncbi:MAG: cytidine deaminase [Clostridia bacterium]|nr:cytidine deaminase [Clostridia bacterium]
MTDRELILAAHQARQKSYSPYSKFSVGAALLTKDGKVYTGCNIENASFSPTCCAERVAFFSAISAGEKEFDRIAVSGAPTDQSPKEPCSPCGVCRQVIAEFCEKDFIIILGTPDNYKHYTLSELLPLGFSKNNLT